MYSSIIQKVVFSAISLVFAASFALAEDKTNIPVIPGAVGFGMETPAGSGRNIINTSLDPDWHASLVGYWDFNDGAPRDRTRNNNHGELVGNATIIRRGNGGSLRLNGRDDGLRLANQRGYMEPGSSFTIMGWAYLQEPGGTVAENREEGEYWELRHNAGFGGKWQFRTGNGAGDRHHAEWHDHITENKWRHVAGVYDGDTGRFRLFINGNLLHNAWNKEVKDLEAARSSNMFVGSGVSGLVDDVMLFNSALSQKEIMALFAAQSGSYFEAPADIYRVTNRNDSGPGSLREGIVDQERARTIIFEVSGTIALKSSLRIDAKNSHLTIAGQTAPSPGITIKNHGFGVGGGATDILIQHLRLRTGDQGIPANPTKSQMPDPIEINPITENLVVDHCSVSWGTDMNLMTGADNATFSNIISAEALHTPLHPKGPHSKGFYVLSYHGGERGGHNTAILRNLIAFNFDRNPAVSAGSAVVANNYLYGTRRTLRAEEAGANKGPVRASFVANVVDGENPPIEIRSREFQTESRYYISDDNIYNGETVADPWNGPNVATQHPWPEYAPLPEYKMVDAREDAIWIEGHEPMPAEKVKEYVLTNAGARPADRDAVDKRIVEYIRRGEGGGIIASQDEVGGWPELEENHRELTLPEDPFFVNDDGYTNLEKWLHEFAEEVERFVDEE